MTGSSRAVSGLILLSLVLLLPGALRGQEPPEGQGQGGPPGQAPLDTADLVFEREVFSYPEYTRRNPFSPLLTSTGGGPRFEQLELAGVIYSPEPGRSIALLRIAGLEQQGNQVSFQNDTQRLREGDDWGNTRVVDIQRMCVVVEVEEFGLTEQRVMRLPRATDTSGGCTP